MPATFNSESKIIIRVKWNKLIIKYLSKKLGEQKVVYLGLPSPDAEDVLEWIDYIDKVIAFQCRDYSKPSSPDQNSDEVEKLQRKLSELERKRKISTFVVYDGYIEEVLLNRRDNSGIEFETSDLIHIYNLDFCNSITSPIEVVDQNGDIQKAYKFDAVEVLLQLQSKLKIKPKKFVLFLTIHSSYDGKELQNFVNVGPYKDEIKSLSGLKKRNRFLRRYVLEALKDYFKANGFIPEFLPVISYSGLGNQILLHFSVIGTSKTEAAGPAPFYQDIDELIRQKFITISEGDFVELNEQGIDEKTVSTNPINAFAESKVCRELWKN